MIARGDAKASHQVERGEAAYKTLDGHLRPVAGSHPTRKPRPSTRVAVLAVHGMGQQVPFATLEDVAQRLAAADAPPTPATSSRRITLTNVAFDDLRLQRVELTLRRAEHQIDAHLYEAYWAPITEGKVFFRDVVRFFASGARNALFNVARPFYRWMFGKAVEFHPPVLPFLALFLATVAVLELAAIGVVVIGLAVARLPSFPWLSREFLESSNVLLAALLVTVIAAALGMGLAVLARPRSRAIRILVQALAILPVLAAVAAALLVVPAIFALAVSEWTVPAWIADHLTWTGRGCPAALVLGAVFLCSLGGRWFVVQYVGDVAAYVSPQALDRFADLRKEIKDGACRLAHAILQAESDEGGFEYDRVAMVGHSLGSVIAYDVLNRLIVDERMGLTAVRPLERVKLLLTFGSPLDKTALIFGLNGRGTGVIREQLAARVQPLIEDYRFRPMQWVNVYSPVDLFSGKLDFYDDAKNPASAGHRVINVLDPDALVPIAAHVQYWDSSTVWTILHKELFDPGSTPAQEVSA